MTTWLQHVKQVHAAGSTSFKESLKRASASWKKAKGSAAAKAPKKKAPKKKRGKKKAEEEPISIEEQEEPAKKKKRRRRAKKASPELPAKDFKNIDSRSLR